MSFTHLHLHTLYSLLDGAIRIKDLVKTVREKGMSSVAVTDHGNMFGAIDFYRRAKEAGLKPILGSETYVAGAKGRTDRTEADSHYIKREDAKAHELLMCIASGKTLADSKRMRHSTDRLYVTSPEEMLEYFKDVPEAVYNTQRIAEMVTLELSLGKAMLPSFKVPDDHTPDSYMKYSSIS